MKTLEISYNKFSSKMKIGQKKQFAGGIGK